MSGWPRWSETRNVVTTATSATPPARPSRPSIRFMALVTPAIQSMVKGRFAHPSAIGSPNGFARVSNRNPIRYMKNATMNWIENFLAALAPRRSS